MTGELNRYREPMLQLADNFKRLQQMVEDNRRGVADLEAVSPDQHHPDLDKLSRDVTHLLNKWQRHVDSTEHK